MNVFEKATLAIIVILSLSAINASELGIEVVIIVAGLFVTAYLVLRQKK